MQFPEAKPGGVRVFPMSFAQQRLWLLNRLMPAESVYNLPRLARLRGNLEIEALRWTLNDVVRRHEALRTTFAMEDGAPVQVIAPESTLGLGMEDLRALPEPAREAEARRRAQREAQTPFDLARGPLIRARLLQLGESEHWLLLTLHHTIADNSSLAVLWQELATLYEARCRGHSSPLADLSVQYADYTVWQRKWWQGAVRQEQLAYWKKALSGLTALELPTDRPRPLVASYRGERLSFTVGEETTRTLRVLAKHEGTTLFTTLLAAFQVLLYRYTGQDDLAIGVPVAGRVRPESKALIGLFVNMLVLRGDLSGEPSFREYLGRVRARALEAYANQDVPFETLVEELAPERNLSRNPLFQVSLNKWWIAEEQTLRLAGLEPVEVSATDNQTSKFDLTFNVVQKREHCHITAEYAADLFDAPTIERLARHFQQLLEGIAADPEQRISQLPLLASNERQQLLVQWNDTAMDYPRDLCIHQLFEQQVERTPEAVAVVFGEQQLSYRELNARANQLAHHLRTLGVGPEVLVGICLERSLELVVGLLGILKAGGAYVPLDPSYPAQRLAFMLEDTQAPVLLTQERLLGQLPAHSGRTLCLDQDRATVAAQPAGNPPATASADNLAYVIFTSGSTGRPKGAMNAHRGICNRLLWMQEEYGLGGDDRVLQKTPISFDVSVWEFFWPLMTGARLVIARPEGHKDSAYLVRLIRENGITTLHFVPSMLRVFLEEQGVEACGSLRRVICSGEALPHELQERFFARLPGVELQNLYGPTEAAVDVTYWACRRGDERLTVPIGRPVANTQIYVLDPRLEPVPVGVSGELYIGGVQVGRGYVGHDDLTAERFVPDPFSPTPQARLYKTGDLARHLSDGAIEYLGRLDYQVKIRGQRIELGEIEATLDKHTGVGQSVVVMREDAPGDQRLVAYVVTHREALVAADLRVALKQHLPDYMIPAAFVRLPALPLTPNGKIDRKALPAPEVSEQVKAAYVAPRTATEETLAQIWGELLSLERVGIEDNFFELGGHSLLAARVVSQVRQSLSLEVPLRELFVAPTIAELSVRIDALRTEGGLVLPRERVEL